MNQAILMGRLTRDPEMKGTVARYTLAVDRRFKRDGEPDADFIRCVCFGKTAEFAMKYFVKGTKIAVTGRIQTGSYADRAGNTVSTTEVIVENQEFCESKKAETATRPPKVETPEDDWMKVPEGYQEELPFA